MECFYGLHLSTRCCRHEGLPLLLLLSPPLTAFAVKREKLPPLLPPSCDPPPLTAFAVMSNGLTGHRLPTAAIGEESSCNCLEESMHTASLTVPLSIGLQARYVISMIMNLCVPKSDAWTVPSSPRFSSEPVSRVAILHYPNSSRCRRRGWQLEPF